MHRFPALPRPYPRGRSVHRPDQAQPPAAAPARPLRRAGRGTRALLLLSLVGLVAGARPLQAAPPRPELGVSYDNEAPEDPDRTYDYFPPRVPGGAVVLFVQSRFWSERLPTPLLHRGIVRGLIQRGHAVLVVRHRDGEAAVHPAPVRDLARAIAHVLPRLEAAGHDPRRIFLAGQTSGAQLALLVALDPTWLAAHDVGPDRIAGVIALSPILDLAPRASRPKHEEARVAKMHPTAAARSAASPITHLSAKRPPILVLNAGRELPGYVEESARFVAAAREVGEGPIERFVSASHDHTSLLDLAAPNAASHPFAFLATDWAGGDRPERWQIAQTWRNPPQTTEVFYERFEDLVEIHAVDDRFLEVLNRPFGLGPGRERKLHPKRYAAIELGSLLDALGPAAIGAGDHLVVTNVRREKSYLSMADVRRLGPRVVIGLDEERNLFRVTDLYHTRRRYTWRNAEAERVDMARPLGAFLFFPEEEPPRSKSSSLFGRYALTLDAFERRADDPRAVFGDLPPIARETLVERHHCISCHRVRGEGGRAFHIRASDGSPMGGHALPLTRYPAAVWKRFVFEQEAVAEEIGADVVVFRPGEARALYDWVVAERERTGARAWSNPERDRRPR